MRGRPGVWRRAVVHDWLPLIGVLFLYDLLRGVADELGGWVWGTLPALDNGKDGAAGVDNAHVLRQLRADEWLFGWFTGDQVPTVWLQDALYVPGDVQWYDIAIVPVERGEAYANAVAAVPSLHSAVPMMVLLFAWPLVGRWLRVLLVGYVLAMTFTLTYGGEHYVVGAFLGWAYAAAAVYGIR